jgi:uncharacterized protein (UPF0335 family)
MIDRIFSAIRRFLASAERDRMAEKFDHVDDNFSAMDDRIDRLEIGQAEIKADVKAIRETTLANSEVLESKINRSTVTSESVRQIVDARIDGFQGGMKRLEELLNQIIRRDCNLP